MFKSRSMSWVGHVAHTSVMRNTYDIFVRKQGMKPLRRPRNKWEDNIIMDIREIEWEGMVF
jgi:hypothetical protein